MSLLGLMLKEEFRLHSSYSSRWMFLSFPVIAMLFSLAIAVTSGRLFQYTPLGQAVLLLHVSVFLYGVGVGAFGFLGRQLLERQAGQRNYLVAMPAILPISFRRTFLDMYARDALFYVALLLAPMVGGLALSVPFTGFRLSSIAYLAGASFLSFLLGMSLSFAVSTVWMRSPVAFGIVVAIVVAAFAAVGVVRIFPPEALLPGLAMNYRLPPFSSPSAASVLPFLGLAVGGTAAMVAAAVAIVPETYESRTAPQSEQLAGLERRFRFAPGYAVLLAKEWLDIRRSGTAVKMAFSFVAPLVFLSFTAWFVRYGLTVPVGFNTVFYGAMVGFFGVILYNWLNNIDAADYLATLPLAVPQMIRAKLLAFLLLTTWIGVAFVVGVSAVNGDLGLLWLALPVMVVTSVYMVVMTAYLTGLRTNSFLFDPGVLARFTAMSMLPDIGITILSFTVAQDLAFSAAGIGLVLAVLVLTTYILYRGIGPKWRRAEFTD